MSDADKPELRPANENPWYCLATLHGEQPVDGWYSELTSKNRLAWNRWIATGISAEEREFLVSTGFPAAELKPLLKDENENFCARSALVQAVIPPPPPTRADPRL